jgi:hypothetical protein
MHAVDYMNCSQGVNGGQPYCPNLAALGESGVNYLQMSTSKTALMASAPPVETAE